MRSWWPTMAEPSPLLVQLPQVVSPPAVEYMPCGSRAGEDVVHVDVSPRPLTTSPFSVSAVCLVMLLLGRVQVVDALGDHHALGVLPRPLADAVARVDAGVAARLGGAQVGAPVGAAPSPPPWRARCSARRRREAAEVGALARAGAGDEEGHGRSAAPTLLRLAPARLPKGRSEASLFVPQTRTQPVLRQTSETGLELARA